MAVKFTKTDDLDKMFEEFAKLPDLKQVTFPDDKEKKDKAEKKKQMTLFQSLPSSVLQAGAIFLSIIIEALPFVSIGSIISGAIEVYVTPEKVYRFLPTNRLGRIFFGTFIGFLFPSCECGIVPIINRFLEKKVPSYTAVPFLVTAPIINPIVLFATYSAFGNSFKMVLLRALGSILVATILGILLGFFWEESIQKENRLACHEHDFSHLTKGQKLLQVFIQAIDEFFDMGRYLVFGCIFASIVQVYVPTRILTSISATPLLAIVLLMVLSFLLSLCSEADAFIGSSLLSSFGFAPVLAFLVIGPMLDVKNLLMMKNYLKTRFIWQFMTIVTLVVLVYSYLVGVML